MEQKIRNRIRALLRFGAIPAVTFSMLNMVGITKLAPINESKTLDATTQSIQSLTEANTIRATNISEAIIRKAEQPWIDVSYLNTGTSANVVYFPSKGVVVTGKLAENIYVELES